VHVDRKERISCDEVSVDVGLHEEVCVLDAEGEGAEGVGEEERGKRKEERKEREKGQGGEEQMRGGWNISDRQRATGSSGRGSIPVQPSLSQRTLT